jgi:hypothetical protein
VELPLSSRHRAITGCPAPAIRLDGSAPSGCSAYAQDGGDGGGRPFLGYLFGYGILARRATMPGYQRRRDRAALRKAARLARKLRKVAPVGERAVA